MSNTFKEPTIQACYQYFSAASFKKPDGREIASIDDCDFDLSYEVFEFLGESRRFEVSNKCFKFDIHQVLFELSRYIDTLNCEEKRQKLYNIRWQLYFSVKNKIKYYEHRIKDESRKFYLEYEGTIDPLYQVIEKLENIKYIR